MATNCVVIVHHGEPVDSALGRLKKELLKIGMLKEMKRRAFYEKPSIRKRRKQTEARKKRRKAEVKAAHLEEWYGEKLAPQKLNPWRR